MNIIYKSWIQVNGTWRRVVDKVRTLIEEHNTEFDVFAKTVLNFNPANY